MTLNSDYIEKKWKGSRRLFTFHRSLINSFIGKKKKINSNNNNKEKMRY